MINQLSALVIAASILFSAGLRAEPANGLNVIVTSADRQSQMMAMMLSFQTMKEHGKSVNMALCGPAGDLVLSSTETDIFLPPRKSPSTLLQELIDMGANVQVCPLYLPSVGKTAEDLLPGISIAKPSVMAFDLLDRDFQNLTF